MLGSLVLLLCGLASMLYGIGMAFYTWFRPGDPRFSLFKPSWRYAIKASRRAAYAQVPLFMSFGAACVLKVLHFQHTRVFGFLVLGFGALCLIFFVADWLSQREA